jgi:hypothetical protein
LANQPDYRAQAAKCRADADASTLDNVRDRNLRAEAAWLDMAIRQERAASSRIAREAVSASQLQPQQGTP